MRALLCVFLLCFSFCFGEEPLDLPEGYELAPFPVPEELLPRKVEEAPVYLEALPSTIVAGCVNAITGDYCETVVDLVVPGPRPLVVERSFCTADNKWHFTHRPKLKISRSSGGHHLEALYQDDSGSGFFLRGSKKLELPEKCLKVHKKAFDKGLTNCGSGEISGQTNWRNAAIYSVQKGSSAHLLFRHGSRTDRLFQRYHSGAANKYRLVEERQLPSKK